MIEIKKIYSIVLVILLSILSIIFFVKNKKENDSTIKLGVLLHMTRKYAPHGIAAHDGINLLVDEINSNGGIEGKKIECIEYDDEGNPAEGTYDLFYYIDGGAVYEGTVSETPSFQ